MGFDFKSARPEDVRKKLDEITRKSSGYLTLAARALNDVEDAIYPEEEILAIGEGLYNHDMWLILVTDRRILMLCRGLLFGFKSKSIRMEDVAGVTAVPGSMMTKLVVQEGTKSIEIDNIHNASAQYIEGRIRQVLKGQKLGIPAVSMPEDDHLVALAELVKKREQRQIDDEEFDRQKAELMRKYIESGG
jgi:hypothetical protein